MGRPSSGPRPLGCGVVLPCPTTTVGVRVIKTNISDVKTWDCLIWRKYTLKFFCCILKFLQAP